MRFLQNIAGLWLVRKRALPPGALFSLFLIGTSVARFVVETVRVTPRVALGLSQAQLIAIGLTVAAVVWLLVSSSRFARSRAASGA